MQPWGRSKTKVPGFKHHSVPCPVHPTSGAYSTSNSCRACMLDYKKRVRELYGPSQNDKFLLIKRTAKRRGIEFNLTFLQYQKIVTASCVYGQWQGEPSLVRIGIDRRDNYEGYTVANSQPCCYDHNRFKSDLLTHDQAMDAAERYGIHCGDAPRRDNETVEVR
jgi:hypothetical protein